MKTANNSKPTSLFLNHTCQQASHNDYYLKFCHICGKVITNNLGRPIIVFRPSAYNISYQYNSHPHMILEGLLKNQSRNRLFNSKSAHLQHRQKLILWLEDLSEKLEFGQKTLQLTISIMDVVFATYTIPADQHRLVVFMGMIVAAKTEESPSRIPSLKTVRNFFGNEVDLNQLVTIEQQIFKILNYSLNFTTPFDFLAYFVYRGVVTSDDFSFALSETGREKMQEGLERLLKLFLRASYMSYNVNVFKSVTVGCAIIACARKYLGCNSLWNKQLELLTGEVWGTISDCVVFLERVASEMSGGLCEEIEIEESVKYNLYTEKHSIKARKVFGFPLGKP